jgi:hypothetical protein
LAEGGSTIPSPTTSPNNPEGTETSGRAKHMPRQEGTGTPRRVKPMPRKGLNNQPEGTETPQRVPPKG